MRYLFVLLAFVSFSASAQKFALIDKNAKLPILYTDSVSVEQVKQGYFPVDHATIDTFYANLNYMASIMDKRQRSKAESFELRNGSTVIKVKRVPYAYGDRYTARGTTQSGNVNGTALLVDYTNSNKKSAAHLRKMMSYMAKNKDVFRMANSITPKIYALYVISDK